MMLNTNFNNISVISWLSVISWWSVLLVEKTGVPRKNTDLLKVTHKLYHIMLYTSPWTGFELTTLVMIGTDCTGSCKSNYHMIMIMTAPYDFSQNTSCKEFSYSYVKIVQSECWSYWKWCSNWMLSTKLVILYMLYILICT